MSFDTLAPFYRTMEFVLAGNLMQRGRTTFLPEVAKCRRALLLGEGPGRFLEAFLDLNRVAAVTCVERSSRMISVAQTRVATRRTELERVEFVFADAQYWRGGGRNYDLVVTNFFLDCFTAPELARLVASVAERTAANAQWLLADFQMPARGWRRWRAGILLKGMYTFFRAVTGLTASQVTPADAFLRAAGFELRNRREINFGFVHADLWVKTSQ